MDNIESSPNSAHINDYISPLKFHETSQTVACVGNNGGTYDEWIRDGFFKAVNLIYTQIRQCHDEDIYIYPMFYCARHSAELGLKIAIRNILEIYRLKKCAIPENANKSYATHDITQLSDILKLLITVDNRLRAEYPSASIYLADYQDDELSDLFRYATSVDGSPNLASANISSIDVDILYQHCCAITDDYSAYIALSEQLIEEYRQGTHTKELSRKQIGDIAHILPPYSQWCDPVFDERKKQIIQEYHLPSNKSFTKAVNLIRNHWEFSAIVGKEIPVPYLNEDAILSYSSCVKYISQKSLVDSTTHDDNEDDISQRLKDIQSETRTLANLSASLTENQISALLTFKDIGKEGYYSEQFDSVFKYTQKMDFDRTWAIRKIANNSTSIIKGLKKCGQISLLNLLLNQLNSESI